MFVGKIEQTIIGQKCLLRVPLQQSGIKKRGKSIESARRTDIFVCLERVFIYVDVKLFYLQSACLLDVSNIKEIVVNYNSAEQVLTLELGCFPNYQLDPAKIYEVDKCEHLKLTAIVNSLERITDSCRLQVNNMSSELLSFLKDYNYGFASQYSGALGNITNPYGIKNPEQCSPLQRTYLCNCLEENKFSADEYKISCVELFVPDGHENPFNYSYNYDNCKLTANEEALLLNLMKRPRNWCEIDVPEIENGLVSILLAICYDIRTTFDESNCESGWTRSVLSSLLTHFESFNELSDVIIRFIRRALSLPLFRNYQLAILCVRDVIFALKLVNNDWILKQLLATHEIFETDENERDYINSFYLKDYICYFAKTYTTEHCKLLAQNLKNALYTVNKDKIDLKLLLHEREMLKEIFGDVQFTADNVITTATAVAATSNVSSQMHIVPPTNAQAVSSEDSFAVDTDDEDDEDDEDNDDDNEEDDTEEEEEEEEDEDVEEEQNEDEEQEEGNEENEQANGIEINNVANVVNNTTNAATATSPSTQQNKKTTSKDSVKSKPILEACMSNLTL